MSMKKKVEDALEALESATAAYEEAREEAEHARRVETDALNRLNRAQAHFDGLMEEVRGGAPSRTDWRSR